MRKKLSPAFFKRRRGQGAARLARPAGRGNLCLFLKNGIEALLGRCEEQSYADGISDRGTPYGFMYATSDSYKMPSADKDSIISVPWCNRDMNLAYHTGWSEVFGRDTDEQTVTGLQNELNAEFRINSIMEYKEQTKYNKVVPIIIQQEYVNTSDVAWEPENQAWLNIFDEVLKFLNNIINI